MLTAAQIIEFGFVAGPGSETASEGASRIVEALDRAGRLAPEPQIIRTTADLEALDPDTALVSGMRTWIWTPLSAKHPDLPAVVVASGEHLRACREALEGEAHDA